MTQILRIDSSARHEGSASRELATRLIDRLGDDIAVVERDLAAGVPLLNESTLAAMWTPADEQTDQHRAELEISNAYIDELMTADAIVIGLPIYNFGPPAAMKAWADLVARAGTTFRYAENGPEGLVPNKPVYIVVASGGGTGRITDGPGVDVADHVPRVPGSHRRHRDRRRTAQRRPRSCDRGRPPAGRRTRARRLTSD